MNEILQLLNALKADELDSVIMRANIILEKKRKEEAEQALLEQERLRQEKIEQERLRQEEIAQLQRRLRELQQQSSDIPDAPRPQPAAPVQPRPQPAAPVQPRPQPAAPVQPRPQPAAPVQPRPQPAAPVQPRPQPAAPVQPRPQPAAPVQPAPSTGGDQVRYAETGEKEWSKIPNERILLNAHDIVLIAPAPDPKLAYLMQITNRRILLTRVNGMAHRMMQGTRAGFGLVGSLVAAGIEKASDNKPAPWIEIPLTAIKSCGLHNKKEFFFEADQLYVVKNKRYDKLLPTLVENAKKGIF